MREETGEGREERVGEMEDLKKKRGAGEEERKGKKWEEGEEEAKREGKEGETKREGEKEEEDKGEGRKVEKEKGGEGEFKGRKRAKDEGAAGSAFACEAQRKREQSRRAFDLQAATYDEDMKGAHARSLYPHVLSALRECAAALAAGADGDAFAPCRQTTRIPYDSHPACSPHTPRILHVSRSLRTLHPPCDSHALGDSGAPCDSRDSHALGDSGTPCDSRAPHALSRPLRILDMGCGTGALAQQVLEAFPSCELSGVDLSERMLSRAAARLGSRARLACADSERLPFSDGLFDLAYCNDSFHHYPDPHRAAFQAWRVLAAGGAFVIGDCWQPAPARALMNAFMRHSSEGDVRIYSESELRAILSPWFSRVEWRRVDFRSCLAIAVK